MPSSSVENVVPVIRTALELAPDRVLDLGMGTGKYGLLLREQIDWAVGREHSFHLTGVEGYEAYIGAQQRLAYDEIAVGDIADYLANTNGHRWDVALLCDVIEHFDPQQAVDVVDRTLDVAEMVIVSTPARFYRQEITGNDLETHRSWWPGDTMLRLARVTRAKADIATIEHTVYAALSRTRQPRLVYDRPAKALLRSIRDAVRPPKDPAAPRLNTKKTY